jgi:hypothetical protein
MKTNYIIFGTIVTLFSACALEEPEVQAEVENYPFRLEMDQEGADLADAEDFGAEISFADYLGDLPGTPIVLTYELSGKEDFSNVAIDEIIYEYEDDDECVFERTVDFTASTITIPVDSDLGTVPESIEVVFAFNLTGDEAQDGGFEFVITGLQSDANVLFNDVSTFEYGILDNDAAGAWTLSVENADEFNAFKEVFAPVSADLSELQFEDITGEIAFEFEFEEVKIVVELNETEEVTVCEEGVESSEIENVIVEIEAEYEAEEGELVFEGSYFTEDGEELDFILETEYTFDLSGNLSITFLSLIDEDDFEEGEELYTGSVSINIARD